MEARCAGCRGICNLRELAHHLPHSLVSSPTAAHPKLPVTFRGGQMMLLGALATQIRCTKSNERMRCSAGRELGARQASQHRWLADSRRHKRLRDATHPSTEAGGAGRRAGGSRLREQATQGAKAQVRSEGVSAGVGDERAGQPAVGWLARAHWRPTRVGDACPLVSWPSPQTWRPPCALPARPLEPTSAPPSCLPSSRRPSAEQSSAVTARRQQIDSVAWFIGWQHKLAGRTEEIYAGPLADNPYA